MDTEHLMAVKDRVEQAWTSTCQFARVRAELTDWRTSLTPDGTPLLSAKVTGFQRGHALRAFGADGATLPTENQRPVLDYSTPGRIQCEWRDAGVWVQLWHPDTALPSPAVLAAFPKPQHPMAATPSGRLRFRRNKKERTTT
ncbi:hypothetical protein [Streptomyces xanthochromogenes]